MSQPDLGECLETYFKTVQELRALYPTDVFTRLYSRQVHVILATMTAHGQHIPPQAQVFCSDFQREVGEQMLSLGAYPTKPL